MAIWPIRRYPGTSYTEINLDWIMRKLKQQIEGLVASVNGEGLVTFLNAGQTTITVKCKGNPAISATITFTVKNKEVLVI